jgi:F-type H+-transporting ATPase subunit b
MVLTELFDSAHGSAGRILEGGVEVDFQLWPILVQVGIVLVLMILLKPALFDPMLRLFEERERRIDGAKVLARRLDEESAGALTKYEREMAAARAAGNVERDKLRVEGQKAEAEILARVRASTAQTLEVGRKKAEEEARAVRTALTADAAQISKELASRVLGREVQG